MIARIQDRPPRAQGVFYLGVAAAMRSERRLMDEVTTHMRDMVRVGLFARAGRLSLLSLTLYPRGASA